MPKVIWSDIPEPRPFGPLPAGWYLVNCVEIKPSYTTEGIEKWEVIWKVLSLNPELHGRQIRDFLQWGSPDPEKNLPALSRCKLVCHRAGIDTNNKGPVDVTPNDLLERKVMIQVDVAPYTAKDGTQRSGNKVPFEGYREATAQDLSNDIPF